MRRHFSHLSLGLASLFSVIAVLLGSACSDFASPAELKRPQVLALRIEPAVLSPGQRGKLSALVAGPDGPIAASVEWSVERSSEDGAELLLIDGEWWLDVASVATLGNEIRLDAAISVGEETLLATRAVEVAASPRANPLIESVHIDSQAVDDQGIRMELGSSLVVGLEVGIDLSHSGAVTWYASVGVLDIFHQPTAKLVANEPGQGWLIVVCRDGLGGLDWALVPLLIVENSGA